MKPSINNFVKFTLAFVFLQCSVAGCTQAQQTINLSTDNAVLDYLEIKIKQKFSRDKICIGRLDGWEETVIVIGHLGSDDACRIESALINNSYYELPGANLSKIALGAIGWEKANKNTRGELAKLWVKRGLLGFSPRNNQTFAAVSTSDGGIKVVVSLQYPPGITSRNAPKTFLFDKDGGLVSPNNF